MKEYTNSEVSAVIDEVIHSERDRKLLKRRLIDGICYEPRCPCDLGQGHPLLGSGFLLSK